MGIRISSDKLLWTGGRLPFVIDTVALGQQGTVNVQAAIAAWNAAVPFLQLTPRDGESNYAEFIPSSDNQACSSPVGRRGERQTINCAGGVSTILHEIGHAAGLWHEQSRQDRNSFITVLTDNVDPPRLHNFVQHIDDGTDLGEYDYASLMHYGTSFFPKVPGLITLVAPAGIIIGNAMTLSPGDLDALELMYRGRTNWTLMRGKLKHVSAANVNDQWGVNSADNIYRRNGNVWTKISGKLRQISAAADGTVWGVNAGHEIYRRDGSSWTKISGKLKHVSVGSSTHIWGVNADNDIYHRDGNSWKKIDGKLKQISVASDGTVWGVNASNKIYRRDGNSWTQIGGSLKYVSVGSSTDIWGVNANDEIYFRNVVNGEWEIVSGQLDQISVASDGSVWGVNSDNNIYRR